jgi:hypothetical protein
MNQPKATAGIQLDRMVDESGAQAEPFADHLDGADVGIAGPSPTRC